MVLRLVRGEKPLLGSAMARQTLRGYTDAYRSQNRFGIQSPRFLRPMTQRAGCKEFPHRKDSKEGAERGSPEGLESLARLVRGLGKL